ncbi:MAG: glycosyltransferase, partial [Saccharofermentanaceae bacterium]
SIYAENIDKRIDASYVKKYSSLPKLQSDDVILYHLSTGSELNQKVKDFPCRKFLIYHNITPSHYFASYNGATTKLCAMGADETILLEDTFEAGFCDSQYNLDELRKVGYTCPLVVRPILIPFEDYKKKPSQEIVDKFGSNKDEVKNVIFVGRIAPNKCQEDIVSTAYAYNKLFSDEKCKVRFILVGSANGTEKYLAELTAYAKILELDNVIFTNQIPFDEILGFYKTADCLLCMSEHEGFCVPLVEAMCFDV